MFGGELHVIMTDMYDEGDWGNWDTCPTGSYAAGIQLEVRFHFLFTCIHHSSM